MGYVQIQGTGLVYPRFPMVQVPPGIVGNLLIDATGEKVAACGRVFFPSRTGTKNITRVQFLWNAVTKAGGSALTLSLQDVSLTTTPIQPDGTPDQTVAIPNSAIVQNAWFRSDALSATRTVANGDLLAVVVEFDGAGRLGADSFIISGNSSPGGVSTMISHQCCAMLFTASWALSTASPIIVLEFDDGTYGTLLGAFVNKAINTHSYNVNTAIADEFAVVINFPFACKIDGLWALVLAAATADFNLVLYSGTTALETVAVDASSISAAGAAHYLWVPIPERELTPNTDYYVAVKPITTNNISAYSYDVDVANIWTTQDGGTGVTYTTRLDSGSWAASTATRRLFAGVSISQLSDSAAATPTYPPASKVYAGTNRGDGVLGTLHASNIATAAGAGSNLTAGVLQSGVTVDDVTGTLTPPVITYPPASKVYAGTNRGDGVIGTLHASNIATAAGAGVNLTPSILRTGNTVDDVVGTQTDPVITYPPASKVYAGANRGDGVIGTLHASNIATAAGAGVNLAPGILLAGNVVDDVTGTHTEPVVTFPAASKVYAGTNRGDGVVGTLHASNIATAAGAGSNLASGDLRSGVTVDDVAGSLAPTAGGGGGAYTFID